MADSERKNGVGEIPDMKENNGVVKEPSHDPPLGKANMSVVKGLTHSGSGVLLVNSLSQ